jgi:hypothetical protein
MRLMLHVTSSQHNCHGTMFQPYGSLPWCVSSAFLPTQIFATSATLFCMSLFCLFALISVHCSPIWRLHQIDSKLVSTQCFTDVNSLFCLRPNRIFTMESDCGLFAVISVHRSQSLIERDFPFRRERIAHLSSKLTSNGVIWIAEI